jgi:predicted glycoside hydrolase/deacetylase ChbG (UPF0249 family)
MEVRAQIDRLGSAGIKISHVDSHKHLHQLPIVRRAVADVVLEYGIRRIRVSRESELWRRGQSFSVGLSRTARLLLARTAGTRFSRVGLRSPSAFVDIGDLMLAKGNSIGVAAALCKNKIVEIGCHPGTAQAVVDKPGSCDRFLELQFLESDQFKSILSEHDVKLATYWDV